MGLTTEKMSGKTLSKPLKWNSHPSPLCQNISKPLSRKTFFQDYLWQSYSLYISKRYEVRLRWKRASDGSENSRDMSLLKWLLYSKTPNLTRFWVWKARQCFISSVSKFASFVISLENCYGGFLSEVQRNMQYALVWKIPTGSGKTYGWIFQFCSKLRCQRPEF